MFKNVFYGLTLLSAVFLASESALADNSPTLDQVYQAARAGKLDEAQAMMNTVLRDHPNSAKAHFVEAELLAKRGQLANAEVELKNAERLSPGLSFASPQAVQNLKSQIATANHIGQPVSANEQQPASGFPWGLLLLGIAAIAIIAMIMRAMSRRNSSYYPANPQPGMQGNYSSPTPMPPYGGGMAPMGSGGMGSGIMGGLATGAAVGVGMVAGEALAHHFMGGENSAANSAAPVADSWGNTNADMGGSDFGIADNSSWGDDSKFADGGFDVSGGDDWT